MKKPAAAGGDGSKGTVVRVIELLRCFSEGPAEWTLSEIASRVALPRSTAHRLLRLLHAQHVVRVDEESRRYSAGTELYRMAALLAARRPVVQLALPVLQAIAGACDETALLSLYLPGRDEMTFVAKIDSRKPVRYVIDLDVPQSLLWGPSGRAILASLDAAEIERIIAAHGDRPAPDGHRLDRRALREELRTIRRDGFAASRGERIPDAVGIAAPFFFADGSVGGGIAIAIPDFRLTARLRTQIEKLVRDGAARVSSALGYRGARTHRVNA